MFSMDGVLIIDKPAGMTSHDVVARVRKILGERRIGHTGTLDPFATGVLVLLVGRATRIAQFLSNADKEYEAVIRLGYSTDTGDFTGERVEHGRGNVFPLSAERRGVGGEVNAIAQPHPLLTCGEGGMPSKAEVEDSMTSLRGEIEQLPPMYSAKKIAGRKLYEHARRGEQVERKPVRVMIREFEALPLDGALLKTNEDGTTDLRVRVVCSAGTYVRTLAEDLGRKLGMGAHLIELRRTRAGRFQIDAAMTLEKLAEAFAENKVADALISPHAALSHLPSIDLDDDQLRKTLHGLALPLKDNELTLSDGDPVRLSRNKQLIAIGKYNAERHAIHPEVVLGPP